MNHTSLNCHNNDEYTDKKGKQVKSSYWAKQVRKDAIEGTYRRTICEKCKQYFSNNYTRLVYISNFTNGTVCKDCKKRYNLHQV